MDEDSDNDSDDDNVKTIIFINCINLLIIINNIEYYGYI